MSNRDQARVAEEAARLLIDGVETEYLHAKERALMILGLPSQTRLPSNRKIRENMARLTRSELGEEEIARRLQIMREIAAEIMEIIADYDPFLIGSSLTGDIRESSDIDLHAYCDGFEELKELLATCGFEDVEEELVENRKGTFVHLRWLERGIPVEITIYPWSWRDLVPLSSITGKPMKRADLKQVRAILRNYCG
ncbi:MAG: hypothetical protein IPM23_00600 [Candidatus Melainabacteria bacterium]|nr:hypothetical protein [Candidatus Melainabacteria bacterium]